MTRIIFQMDDHSKLNFSTDTTVALMLAFLNRKVEVFYYTRNNLFYDDGFVKAVARRLHLSGKYFFSEDKTTVNLEDFSALFLRDEPPFDISYITSTYLLDRLSDKILIINDPTSIRNSPEKISVLDYSQYIVPTCISQNIDLIITFLNKHKKIILKPLHSFGGKGIFMASNKKEAERYFKKILSDFNDVPILAQKYIENIIKGDKRVVIFDGEILGCLNRVPPKNSYISNLVAGGVAEKTSLTDREETISTTIAQDLKKEGILLAGLDLIDEYLSEINVTCPTGVVAINRLNNLVQDQGIEYKVVDKILSQA
ncbi:MAG: glutathione synthase [Rickettsiales bacterium]